MSGMSAKETSYHYEEMRLFLLNELVSDGVPHEVVHWYSEDNTTWCVVKVFEQDEEDGLGDYCGWWNVDVVIIDNSDKEDEIPLSQAYLVKSSGLQLKGTGYVFGHQLDESVQKLFVWAREHKCRVVYRRRKGAGSGEHVHQGDCLTLVVVDMGEYELYTPQSYAFLLNNFGYVEQSSGYVFGQSLPYHEQKLRDWAYDNQYQVNSRHELGA